GRGGGVGQLGGDGGRGGGDPAFAEGAVQGRYDTGGGAPARGARPQRDAKQEPDRARSRGGGPRPNEDPPKVPPPASRGPEHAAGHCALKSQHRSGWHISRTTLISVRRPFQARARLWVSS